MATVQTGGCTWVLLVICNCVTLNQNVGAKIFKILRKKTSFLILHRFNTFHLEASSSCRYDYVAVYDGPDTLSPLMGKFCGAALPPDLRSSTNQLFIVFRTDASVNGIGWRATYSETLGRLILLDGVAIFAAHACNKQKL